MSYSTCPSIGAAIEPDVDLKSQIHAHPRGGGEAEKVMQTETVQEHTKTCFNKLFYMSQFLR